MGAACCVAAKDRTIPVVSSGGHRNWSSRHSPTWSFWWESRGRVAGEDSSIGCLPATANNYHTGMDSKLEMTFTSEHGRSLDGFQSRTQPKSPLSNGTAGHVRNSGSDPSISRATSMETASQQVESRESFAYVLPSPTKLSVSSTPSHSSSSTPSSQSHLQHASSTPLRQSDYSRKLLQLLPGYISPAGKSPRSPRAAVAVLSTPSWGNELRRGSSGGLTDGWSVDAFTELASSSLGATSSLGSEAKGMSSDRICEASSHISASTSSGVQTCGFCLKSLTERSSWSGQKIIANNELPVVAVLICGHVYHADCLEAMTLDINKYDPACPVCTLGEKQTFEMSEKALLLETESSVKRERRRSRNQGVDSEASWELARLRVGGSMGSSSASRSPSPRPFFRRHFSFGSRGSRTLTEVHPNQRRGLFWTMSSKE